MVEAIALLIESIAGFVAALVELLAVLIETVAVLLGLMTQPASKPEQGKAASRVWAVVLLVAGGFAVVGVGLYWSVWRPAQLRGEARELVSREARRLVKLVDARGRLVPDDNAPRDIDPWGRPVTRTYSQTRVAESVEVRSSGPTARSAPRRHRRHRVRATPGRRHRQRGPEESRRQAPQAQIVRASVGPL